LALLPASTTEALKSAESATRDDNKLLLNVGVGYGGRQEIIEAVKGYAIFSKVSHVEMLPNRFSKVLRLML
jgi:undecaprenyl diphosphate synthase